MRLSISIAYLYSVKQNQIIVMGLRPEEIGGIAKMVL